MFQSLTGQFTIGQLLISDEPLQFSVSLQPGSAWPKIQGRNSKVQQPEARTVDIVQWSGPCCILQHKTSQNQHAGSWQEGRRLLLGVSSPFGEVREARIIRPGRAQAPAG